MFRVNLFGQMHVTQAVLPYLRAQGHGTIAFTSSSAGWTPLPFMSHYAASKAALTAYVESLEKEVRPLGIRCLSFESGGFPTHLGQPRDSADGEFGGFGSSLEDYTPTLGKVLGMFASDPMSLMPGDLAKVGSTIVDVINGAGVAAGKPRAVHVVIGSDSYASIKQKCEEELHLLEVWKDVSFSTDRVDHSHAPDVDYLKTVSIQQ